MPDLSYTFRDGQFLEYGEGRFDNWCVFLKRPDQERFAPRDCEYLSRIGGYGSIIGCEKVYSNLVEIYNIVTTVPNVKVLERVESKCIEKYAPLYGMMYALKVAVDYCIVYMGMVAEENKENCILGKRIKRLGFHQVLLEGMDALCASEFSKGKKHYVLDKICSEKGF